MMDQARSLRDDLRDLEQRITDAMKLECPIQIGMVIRNRKGTLGKVNSWIRRPNSPFAFGRRTRGAIADGDEIRGLYPKQWFGGEWELVEHAIGE